MTGTKVFLPCTPPNEPERAHSSPLPQTVSLADPPPSPHPLLLAAHPEEVGDVIPE